MFGPEFFPTPAAVAVKMMAKISDKAVNFLEPSAGKGDLAEAIANGDDYSERRWRRTKVDCIEIVPELVSVLQGKDFPVVGYDWLSYNGVCYYDAIVMNPPFSNGDDHLLRAWDFLHDGEIVCLLNEETVRNPHTAARQRLEKIIRDHGSVEFIGDCFSTAQRKTDVRVALVYLRKVSDDDRVDLWSTAAPEKPVDADIHSNDAMLAVRDVLGNMEHHYNMANEHMQKAFEHARKAAIFMQANNITPDRDEYEKMLGMALRNVNSARAEFARKHRRDAWTEVFSKMHFHKFLDKKQHDQFIRDIEKNSTIPFNAENIKGTLENVFSQRHRLFEQSCANVFDELTRYYKGNTSHTEGWKTNDSYKVNEKLIFPWGCHFDDRYFGKFELSSYGDIDIYNDLDRVLCVLDGIQFEECLTIGSALLRKFKSYGDKYRTGPGGRYSTGNNICRSTYFDIKFWKKGTVHLKFRDRKLWEQFNITASRGKKWLGEETQCDHSEETPPPAPPREEPPHPPEEEPCEAFALLP